jgi:hypothetical protein
VETHCVEVHAHNSPRQSTVPFIHKPKLYLSRDTAITVQLREWPIRASLFDGDDVAGPVRVLFASNTEEATSALSSNPEKAFKDLQRIFCKFFIPENIPASAAMAQLANPRASEVAFPFRRSGYTPVTGPTPKRARTTEAPPSPVAGPSTEYDTTGRVKFIIRQP